MEARSGQPPGKARPRCGTVRAGPALNSANAGVSRDLAGSWQVWGRECVPLVLAEELGWAARRRWDEAPVLALLRLGDGRGARAG